eukprot:UN24209
MHSRYKQTRKARKPGANEYKSYKRRVKFLDNKCFFYSALMFNIVIFIFGFIKYIEWYNKPVVRDEMAEKVEEFYERHAEFFLKAARNYELDPRFDIRKSIKSRLTFDKLLGVQKEKLFEAGHIEEFTDKIKFKEMLQSVGIPVQPLLYKANKDTLNYEELSAVLENHKTGNFIIKPSHLSWGDLQYVYRTNSEEKIDYEKIRQITHLALTTEATGGDIHYHHLEPYIFVEQLFEPAALRRKYGDSKIEQQRT